MASHPRAPDTIQPSGIKGPVRIAAEKCADAFRQAVLRQLDGAPSRLLLRDQLDRLKIWSGALGVFASGQASADYRFREDDQVSEAVTFMINHITRCLEALTGQAAELLTPKSAESGAKPPSIASSDSISDSSSSSDDVVDHPAASVHVEARQSPLEEIADAVTNLYRLSAAIKKPERQIEASKIETFAKKGVDQIEMTELQFYSCWRIKQLFPEAPAFLTDRLGKAVVLRRKRILYRRRHAEKLQVGIAENFGALAERPISGVPSITTLVGASQSPQPRTGVTFRPRTILSDTAASSINRLNSTAYPKSVALSRIPSGVVERFHGLDVPRPPTIAENAMSVVCPYCSKIIKRSETLQPHWTRHVLKDLEPYVCIFENCEAATSTFRGPHDWVQHMRQHAKLWTCRSVFHKAMAFDSKEDFESHMREEHAESFNDNQLAVLVERSGQPGLSPFASTVGPSSKPSAAEDGLCPLCPLSKSSLMGDVSTKTVYESSDDRLEQKLQDHVADHLNRIALWALPPNSHEGSDKSSSTLHRHSYQTDTDLPGLEDGERYDESTTDRIQSWLEDGERYDASTTDRIQSYRELEMDEHADLDERGLAEWGFVWVKLRSLRAVEYSGHMNDETLASFVERAELQEQKAANERYAVEYELDKWPISSTIMPRLGPNFIEREELLEHISGQATVQSAWVALVGLGGVGKTQIAIRHAQRCRVRDSNHWILWIIASNAARFEESIRDVGDQIRLPGRNDPELDILQLIQAWLADSRRRWTIVLDNADDAGFLFDPPDAVDAVSVTKRRIDYFPTCDHGSIIITSRDKNEALKFVSEKNIVVIPPMDVQHATKLLEKSLGRSYNEKSGIQLAIALDCMPLALSQAASFIQNRRYTIDSYLAELEKSRQSRTSLLRKGGTIPERERNASSSIILTWQTMFEHIHSIRRSAADLLALMSFCDRQAIPELLIRGVHKQRNVGGREEPDKSEDDESGFANDIQMLENFSLVAVNAEKTAWDMHRLVQDATQWWLLDRGEMEAAQFAYIEHLYDVIPSGNYEDWQICKLLMPHIKSAMDLNVSEHNASLLWTDIMYKTACFTESQGLYKNAEGMAERSFRVRASLLGTEHPDTLKSMIKLASTYSSQGRWKEAEELQVKTMETRKTAFGAKHPDTLSSMTDLASTYRSQGRWKEAEELQVKAMETSKTVLGAEHPSTLTSMNNLAMTYWVQGRWKVAEELLVNVIGARTTLLGAEHPDTLTSMANLASTYRNQGRWKEAEELDVKVMETRKTLLGAEHPSTLTSMANLASTYRNQGRWKEAEELDVKVMKTRKTVLGAEHPDTLTSMNNLAAIYYHQKRLQQSQSLMEQCVSLRTLVLGTLHPDTCTSITSLKAIEDCIRAMNRDEAGSMITNLTINDRE